MPNPLALPATGLSQPSADANFAQAFSGSTCLNMSLLAGILPIAYVGQIDLYTSYSWCNMLQKVAPVGSPSGYDRDHLGLYAALLEADDAGRDWREAASSLMHLDLADGNAEACWRSHLERARWIVGEGLATALVAFNRRATQ
jgi:hypothetical protein